MATAAQNASDMFYENMRRINDAAGNAFPVFSKKSCGGGNRNGAAFSQYQDGNRLLAEVSDAYKRKPRSKQHLLRPVKEGRQEMAARAVQDGRRIQAQLRYHQLTVPAAPDVARGSVPFHGQPTPGNHRQTGHKALGTKLPPADFKPFRAFSQQRRRPSRRLNPVAEPLYERLAEPLIKEDWYKMEQFVPLMRTW